MASKAKQKVTPAEFVTRGVAVARAVDARLRGMLRDAPTDPARAFEEFRGLIEGGAVDVAREVFLADIAARKRWHFQRGRMTEVEFLVEGIQRGAAAAKDNKTPDGITTTQALRAKRFGQLKAEGKSDSEAFDMLVIEFDRTPQAIRESLKAAGLKISTKDKQR
jgi:ribosomal protein L19E